MRTVGEQKFLEQMTRRKLVGWCDTVMKMKDHLITLSPTDPYVDYAATRTSPFISNRGQTPGTYKILAGGWAAAASFLKR